MCTTVVRCTTQVRKHFPHSNDHKRREGGRVRPWRDKSGHTITHKESSWVRGTYELEMGSDTWKERNRVRGTHFLATEDSEGGTSWDVEKKQPRQGRL